MVLLHPQFITDTAGKKLVILSQNEFDAVLEQLEELEDIRLFDEALKEDDGNRILFDDYMVKRLERYTSL